jgi:apolipoprotein N-acyltransferase
MTWKAIILTILALALIAFAFEHSWIFGASVVGFAVLIWIGYKLDKMTGIR